MFVREMEIDLRKEDLKECRDFGDHKFYDLSERIQNKIEEVINKSINYSALVLADENPEIYIELKKIDSMPVIEKCKLSDEEKSIIGG